jgi:Gti1/Pac2 family transcription factor
MSSGGAALQPTFQGHVATTQDALILFEACLQGHLSHVPRRPHDRERSSLIRSGCVFIYEENASGIKRWTDGVTWSPSRILGNFLVYRELDKPFPPGEKKRAMKKNQRRPSRPGEPYPSPLATENGQPAYVASGGGAGNGGGGDRTPSEVERQLIGSLIDSYGFKADGLVKKTMSVTVQGVTHHLVSYYNVHDVIGNVLRTPSQTENLQYIRPRPELTSKQSFRSPIEEVEEVEGIREAQRGYGYPVGSSQGYVQDYRASYSMSQYYPPMSQAPPGNYTGGVPPMQPGYLQTAVSGGQLPPQRHDYGHYDQHAYNRSYDSLSSATGKSMPPTANAIPPMMPGRDQQQSLMYPPSSVQRPLNNLSPVPMDSRNHMPYRPSPYLGSATSPIDPNRPSDAPHIKYEDRRETGHQPGQMYDNSRPTYYGGGSTPQMHQAQYSQSPSMNQWSGSGHPQQ